jgi:hypothetical protein
VAHASGVVAAISLVQRSRTSAAPVVADVLGTAGLVQVGGALESSSEHMLPGPTLVLTKEYVKSCCTTPTVPALTTLSVCS